MEGSLYAAMYQRGLGGLKLKFHVRLLLMISGRQSSHQFLGADPTQIFFYCIDRDHDSGPLPFSHHKAFIFRLWKFQRTIGTFFLNLKCPPVTLVTFCSVPTACVIPTDPHPPHPATESVFAPRMVCSQVCCGFCFLGSPERWSRTVPSHRAPASSLAHPSEPILLFELKVCAACSGKHQSMDI